MRITEIEIKNFRAFRGDFKINLTNSGHNLLVYGENGSGKSSLGLALNLFLESSVKNHDFNNHRNIFIKGKDGYVKLKLKQNKNSPPQQYEWSTNNTNTNDPLIIDASKTKGYLDYKCLMQTSFLHYKKDKVNIFDFIIENLLAECINSFTRKTFADDWNAIQHKIPKRNTQKQMNLLFEAIKPFNDGLSAKLKELKRESAKFLQLFDPNIEIDFEFTGVSYDKKTKEITDKEIILTVKFCSEDICKYHHFLNEAKLSSIALSIYFSSLLLNPTSDLKIFVLDDVLIGLDMSNRMPVIEILKKYFSDYQIFFLTYDKLWYDIVNRHTQGSGWKYARFFYSKVRGYELPVYAEDKKYIEKAEEYFNENDYKAAVIYLRTAFEAILKKFCDKKRLEVGYKEERHRLTTQDFWLAVKKYAPQGQLFLSSDLINSIEVYRRFVLNPLSHSTITNIQRREINDTINCIKSLQQKLT